MRNNFDFGIKDRNGAVVEKFQKQNSVLNFLYGSFYGRLFLKLLTRPFISKIVGSYMNSGRSRKMIDGFVTKQGIDMTLFEEKEFISYNDFFTRKIKPQKRPIDFQNNSFISPCDSKLSVFKIDNDSVFEIKDSLYSVFDIIGGNNKAGEFVGGWCLIFRLDVDDYHRYCYIDNGSKGENFFIKGELHTVKPIALNSYNVYKRNCREYTFLQTENFGEVCQIEVGAMMVGRIKNLHDVYSFKKGEEKGMFEFGGSTVILLVKNNILEIDEDIVSNTRNGFETVVKMGEKIGNKLEVLL